MININKKFYKLTTLLIMLCLCFVVTSCKKNVQSSEDGWTCTCGTVNTSNFCSNCGTAKPVWTCSCGTENTGNFCGNCGKQKGEQQEQKAQQEQKQVTNSKNPFKNAEVGDYVKFGNYPQTAEGEEQPIEWQVLAKEGNKMLVLSKYGLDAKRFDSSSQNWGNSEIRQWLNNDFYDKAFNEKEKKSIIFSNLSDVDTIDRVFLLSKDEAEKFFANDEERKCKATEYAVKNGAFVADSDFGSSDEGYSYWWLRSRSLFVYYVDRGGYVDLCTYVGYDSYLVRPALWINL